MLAAKCLERKKERKMYCNNNNLTTVMITWGSNSVVYDLFTCDVNFLRDVIRRNVGVTTSTLKVFIKF